MSAEGRTGGRSLARAVFTVGGLTMGSRVVGFIRDLAIAGFGGAGVVTDAFFIALAIPNFFRRLFGEGAFSAAFTPMFAGKLESEGRAAARAFAEQSLAVLLPALIVATALLELFAADLLRTVWGGLADEPDRFGYALAFMRVTLIYLIFICLVAMFGGVLNALDRFAAMAGAPILFNLTLIAAIALHAALGAGETLGHALAWGVAISGVIQLALMLFAAKRADFMIALRRPRWTPDVNRLIRLMGPAAAAHGVVQINLIIGSALAATLSAGAVTHLYFADRINQLPLGVVGVAVATALLPKLAASLRAGREDEARETQSRALELSLLLGLPAATALALAADPIIDGLFRRGGFDLADAQATAAALAMYALGLPAFLLAKALQTVFFSREEPGAAFKASAISVAVNVAAAFALIDVMGHVGLALAVTLGGWANAIWLAVMLQRRGRLWADARLRRAPRIAAASLAMGGALILLVSETAFMADQGQIARLGRLILIVAAGGAVYLACAKLFGALAMDDLRAMARRRRPA